MKELKFKCTLLTDVVLNSSSASEGSNSTLDFIPGNNFLGIVASRYEKFDKQEQLDLFHNSTVRYGDAHPACGSLRTLHIPASMMHPKLKTVSEKCYIHHYYNRSKDHDGDEGRPQQLKQCRTGYYAFYEDKARPVNTNTSYTVKSSRNKAELRNEDGGLFGYESLTAGRVYYFSVETDNDSLEQTIDDALKGRHRIGCSRSAQYGLVEIERTKYGEVSSAQKPIELDGQKYVTVYAESRLIFLDSNAQPTYRPNPRQLGVPGGTIDWQKSQVRTFMYAPYNYKRRNFDTDRCGIEKGSVFVVSVDDWTLPESKTVGSYRNEGFGKVIYNPDFLNAAEGTNGEAAYTFSEKNIREDNKKSCQNPSTVLTRYVDRRLKEADDEYDIYKMTNKFINNNFKSRAFTKASFASQWGTIRSIAMKCRNNEELRRELIDNEKEEPCYKDGKLTTNIVNWAYLKHGIAQGKWEENNGRLFVENFIEAMSENDSSGNLACRGMVNLASEMAKKCKKK